PRSYIRRTMLIRPRVAGGPLSRWEDEPGAMSNPSPDQRRSLGRWGENLAANHLAAEGLTIIERNWRCRDGEIDLVARDGETFVFVEVKTRRGRDFGAPEEALTPRKAQKLLA